MTSNNYYRENDEAKCPYYRKESPIEVKCLGICGTHSIQVFKNKKEKESYMYDFCCSDYWMNCPQAIQLEIDEGYI